MDRPPLLAVCGLAFEAAIAAGPGVVTVCGPGPGRLAARLEEVLDGRSAGRSAGPRAGARSAWAGIISFGCAGALDPALVAGTCIVATGVETRDGLLGADPAWVRALMHRLPAAREGRLAGLDLPLATPGDKARLWRDSGACAVDMESHVAAAAARRHGVPFAACRVVLDPSWRSVPPCALVAMRDDGRTALLPLLRCLAGAPGELGPLCALALDARRARRGLRQARIWLGPQLALPYRSCAFP
jgi:hopanoid-associated phosphorylase